MPSRRDSIVMDRDEIRVYLRAQHRLILVSNGRGGHPHPMPMNFIFNENDEFCMATFRKSQKLKNLQRDARVSLLVESGIAYQELKSVLCYSEAEIIDDTDEVLKLTTLLTTKESGISGNDLRTVSEQARKIAAKQVVLRCRAEEFISWDHSKLAGQY